MSYRSAFKFLVVVTTGVMITASVLAADTDINPYVINKTTTSLEFGWDAGSPSYIHELSTSPTYNPIASSGTTVNSTITYTSLIPDTTYFFHVKIATDSAFLGVNEIATKTLSGAPLTDLNPFVFATSTNLITFVWDSGYPNYNHILSTDPAFISHVSSGMTSNSTHTYFSLMPDTTYFFRIKISTEPSFLLPNNEQSTMTLKLGTFTYLNHQFTGRSSTTLTVSWNDIGTTYNFKFSTSGSFIPLLDGGSLTGGTTTFDSLSPSTQHFFNIKLATEPSYGFSSISTFTLPSSGGGLTNLNPVISTVGIDFIDVDWDYYASAQYVAAISTDVTFATYHSSFTTGNNFQSYFGLMSKTTYYFKVKLSTETDASYNAPISTVTKDASSHGNFALDFNGVDNQLVKVSTSSTVFDLLNAVTLEFWFKRNSTSPVIQHIISKDNSSLNSGWGIVLQSAGYLRFDPFGQGGGLTSSVAITDTNWHHLALTINNSRSTVMYLDGAQVGSATTNTPSVNGAPLKFGLRENLVDDYNGKLDEIRFWNYSRTQTEIQNQKDIPLAGNEAGLIAYWDMDEGTGQFAYDITANNFQGILGQSPATGPDDPAWLVCPIPGFGGGPDNVPPTVGILHPLHGSTQTVSSLNSLSGTAQDDKNLLDVQFHLRRISDGYYWNDTAGGSWGPGIFWNMANGLSNWNYDSSGVFWSTGTYHLTVEARDMNYNIGSTSSTFLIDVSTESVPPTVAILHPVHLSTHSPANLNRVSGTAADNVGLVDVDIRIIRLLDNWEWDGFLNVWVSSSNIFNPAVGLENWHYDSSSQTWVVDSTYTMVAIARDTGNNVAHATSTFIVQASSGGNDLVPPNIEIIHPASGTAHAPNALTNLYGTASDNVAVVEISIKLKNMNTGLHWDGGAFASTAPVFHFLPVNNNWNYGGVSTSAWTDTHQYMMVGRAKDGNNNFGTDVVFFTVNSSTGDTIPPSLTVIEPVDSGVYLSTSLYIHGNAGDNDDLDKVEVSVKQLGTGLYYDGVDFNSGSQNFLLANGLYSWDFHIPPSAYDDGNYDLEARATDDSGNQTNEIVPFTITGSSGSSDNVDPTIAISTPTDGGTYSDAYNLTLLEGTSADNNEVVEVVVSIKDDNNMYWDYNGWNESTEFWLYSSSNTANWRLGMPYQAWKNGIFEMRARARDIGNNVAYATATFTVTNSSGNGNADNVPPNSYIYNPSNGFVADPHAFTHLDGHAEDAFGIDQLQISLKNITLNLYWNGAGFTSSSEYFINPSISYSDDYVLDWYYDMAVAAYTNGDYLLKVVAKDPSDNTSTVTASFTVVNAGNGGGDVTPPTVSILNPDEGETLTATQALTISGTANDETFLDFVEIRIKRSSDNKYWNGYQWDAAEMWLVAEGTVTWNFDTSLNMWSDGDYTVTANAFDGAANVGTVSNSFTISGTGGAGSPPTIVIQIPVNGDTYSPGALTELSGTAGDDGAVAQVEYLIFDINKNLFWNATTNIWESQDHWNSAIINGTGWSVAAADIPYWSQGVYVMVAEAEDNTGLLSLPATAQFYIDDGSGDFSPPSKIPDLSAQTGDTEGSVKLSWTAKGDDGDTGSASFYTIKYHNVPIATEADWNAAQNITVPPTNLNPPTPLASGSAELFVVTNLTPGAPYFWGIRAIDDAGNRGIFSNSPLGTARDDCGSGTGDGEGTMTIVPSSIPEASQTTLTASFTAGNTGITSGGRLKFVVPPSWPFPQTTTSGVDGYVTYTSNNGLVTFSETVNGPELEIKVESGILNPQDTITITYLASPYCGIQAVEFDVLTQASSCGRPTTIGTNPTVDVTAGLASWIGFDSYEKLVEVGQATNFKVEAQNNCGASANVGSDTDVTISVVNWDSNINTWVTDPQADFSPNSNMTPSYDSQLMTITNGTSELNLYYVLQSEQNNGNNFVRIVYDDFNNAGTIQNILSIIPFSGNALSNLSVDNNQLTQGQTSVSFSPDGDGSADFAFINFEVGDPNLTWEVEVSKNSNSTIVWEAFGQGTPARIGWDGRQTLINNNIAPPGLYDVRVAVGGVENTSTLNITLNANGAGGNITSNLTSGALENVAVNFFGPTSGQTLTDVNGDFSLTGLPIGDYHFVLDKIGYATLEFDTQITGGAQNLGNFSMVQLATLQFNGTRANSTKEIWGDIRGVGSQPEPFSGIHYAIGNTAADDGFGSSLPVLYLIPGIAYSIEANIPGYSITPLARTFTEGESYTWTPTLTESKKISGTIELPNGVANPNGILVDMGAGLDVNQDRLFDAGYPTEFAQVFIPAYESEVNYEFPLNDGIYAVGALAVGFAPQVKNVTLAGANQNLDFVLSQAGQLNVTVNFAGDTTNLDTGGGTFPVTLQLFGPNGFYTLQTFMVPTNATITSYVATFTGIPNGQHEVIADLVTGFHPSGIPPYYATVSAGFGSRTINFVQNSGSIQGTISFAQESGFGDLEFSLLNGAGEFYSNPTYNNGVFSFSRLMDGFYDFSVIDTLTQASEVISNLSVINGQTTDLGDINLAGGQEVYTLSGIVRTVAPPDNDTLGKIASNSTAFTFYDANGSQSISALHVQAYLINPDNTTDPLPTIASRVWNTAKIKVAPINTSDGSYLLSGLKKDKSYLIRLNTDFDSDGDFDFPIEQQIVALTKDKTDLDFTIREGASINGTITSPESESGYSLSLKLTNTLLNKVIKTIPISLVGTEASYSFSNLGIGSYIIEMTDAESTNAKYATKPKFISIDNLSESKTANMTLSRGAVIQLKLADQTGQLITSSNYSSILPSGVKVRFKSTKGHIAEDSVPGSDGIWTANILGDVPYTVEIHPPEQTDDSDTHKLFLPITLYTEVGFGQIKDLGTQILESGTDVSGLVKELDAEVLGNIPVWAYRSLSRNLDPIKIFTNERGEFTFGSMDSRDRFFDIVVNPPSSESNPLYSQSVKTMVDITKTLGTLSFSLVQLNGLIEGTIVPNSGDLTSGFGVNHGLAGAAILITKRGDTKYSEYLSNADGTFNIRLAPGKYDVEIIAQNQLPNVFIVDVGEEAIDLGTIDLEKGYLVSGDVTNADGSLPTTEQLTQLFAIDADSKLYRGHLIEDPITDSIFSYSFSGLKTGQVTIFAVDVIGRIQSLEDYDVPELDSTLNLTFKIVDPQLVASFIEKLPNGVDLFLNCNQKFRALADDIDGDGVADDDEFLNFVTIKKGNGTLAFNEVDTDRQKASYTYTKQNETGNILEVDASYTTQETNPETGNYYTVSGTFNHYFGLQYQQEDYISSLGGQFSLPSGSSVGFPQNYSDDTSLEGIKIAFMQAATLSELETASIANGAGAMAMAEILGPSAYPAHMYRAIKTLAAAPDVNPLSSFYDIFLPVSVSHQFTNEATLTLTYDEGADPTTVNVYYFNEAQGIYTIENTDRRIDTENRTISVSIAHASIFTVLDSSAAIIQGDSYSGELAVFNFPNPFDLNTKSITLQNPGTANQSQTIQGTMIKISVPPSLSGAVDIKIYNVAGELVKTLTDTATAGNHQYLEWDGTNSSGKKVASGIYIGKMTIGGGNMKFFKMAVLK